MNDCTPGQRRIAQDGRTRRGTFHAKIDRCRESQCSTTASSSMPQRDGKGQVEDGQNKRARAGSFAVVD